MSKKIALLIVVVILAVVIILLVGSRNKTKVLTNNETLDENNTDIKLDDETGLYYIRDDTTGEIIHASYDESDLDFYQKHPDYNPNPLVPRSTNLNDFVKRER